MTTFTAEQIGKVAWNAGFGRDVPTLSRAIAVALAESGGNTSAHNGNAKTGDDSYGLWQINMIGGMGPARRKAFGIASNAELLDPTKNAKAAWSISNSGRNWTPWSTFKNGAYLKHIPVGDAAAKKVIAASGKNREGFLWSIPFTNTVADAGEATGQAVGGATDVPGAIARAVNGISQTVFKAGLSFVTVVVAVVLLILGVIILMRSPMAKAAKGAAKVAGAVVPGGKAAKVAGKAAKIL